MICSFPRNSNYNQKKYPTFTYILALNGDNKHRGTDSVPHFPFSATQHATNNTNHEIIPKRNTVEDNASLTTSQLQIESNIMPGGINPKILIKLTCLNRTDTVNEYGFAERLF